MVKAKKVRNINNHKKVETQQIQVDQDSVVENNINFHNIEAANQDTCNYFNELLDKLGNFSTDYIDTLSSYINNSIESGINITEIISDHLDANYCTYSDMAKNMLNSSTYEDIGKNVEFTTKSYLDNNLKLYNDVTNMLSLYFNKSLNKV